MSVVALRQADGSLGSTSEVQRKWKDRIEQGREVQKQMKATWLSNAAFRSGAQWLVWDGAAGSERMRHIRDMDPSYRNRELFVADRINEYVQAQLGELTTGDDRPQILTAQEGTSPEENAKQINAGVAYAWEHEWNAERALARARSACLTFGTSAIRSRFDNTKGPTLGKANYKADGSLVTEQADLDHLGAHGALADGSLPKIKEQPEGRTCWEPYTAFHLLPPPGITHEDDFPYDILCRPVPLSEVKATYGDKAAGLTEDGDIASVLGVAAGTSSDPTSRKGRLRDHVWLFTCFERPCREYPKGQVVVLASNQFELLDTRDELDYRAPNGEYKTGIVYLHWWRLDDRFFSRAFVEPLKGPQRIINERETMNAEIIRRGMPKVFVQKDSIKRDMTGDPLEIVEVSNSPGMVPPDYHLGVGPGDWMWKDLDHQADNLSHASTLGSIRLGESPPGLETYSEFAALNETEGLKRNVIRIEHEDGVGTLVEFGVHDMRKYWPTKKNIMVAGDDGQMSRQIFEKSIIPDWYQARRAKGSSQPRSQAAEIAKVDSIWNAAIATQIVLQEPDRWTAWYADSLKAGEAQDLPEAQRDSQEELADYENFLMLQGQPLIVADYDIDAVHLPAHREAQDQARAAGNKVAVEVLEEHCNLHIAKQKQLAMVQQQAQLASASAQAADAATPQAPPVPSGPPQAAAPPAPSAPPPGS